MKSYLIWNETATALGITSHDGVEHQRDEYEVLVDRMRRCLRGIDRGTDILPTLPRRLSVALEAIQIRWIGSFTDLCEGNSRWARHARMSFRRGTSRLSEDAMRQLHPSWFASAFDANQRMYRRFGLFIRSRELL